MKKAAAPPASSSAAAGAGVVGSDTNSGRVLIKHAETATATSRELPAAMVEQLRALLDSNLKQIDAERAAAASERNAAAAVEHERRIAELTQQNAQIKAMLPSR